MEDSNVSNGLWQRCLARLEGHVCEKDLNVWLRPLQAVSHDSGIDLLAPNAVVRNAVEAQYRSVIEATLSDLGSNAQALRISVGDGRGASPGPARQGQTTAHTANWHTNLDPRYRFESFVEGKSNQMARASAEQAAQPENSAYNPLLIYGGVGLGKTHLMHGVGHRMLEINPAAKVVYVRAEHFVNELVTAIRHNRMDGFKRHYRGVDALLIDDIQFFAKKEQSQEEFFHTFNALLECNQRIVLTCDRFPKEVEGLEDRLKSRFSWGLSVPVEPPELETRVAILMAKADEHHMTLPQEVAFFIAKRVRSNVRDLESALHRLSAQATFTGMPIGIEFAKQALSDILAVHDRLVTVDNIQRMVADYYNLRLQELVGKKRSRSIARPRQIAMALAKELTNHSLPEIGDAFGGRDHTTVLHACRKIEQLRDSDNRIADDYRNLTQTLTR